MQKTPIIVIAHEENSIRETAVQAVQKAGYEVICVNDGEGARGLLSSDPIPDAFVTDVALPGMPCYELCDEISKRGLRTKVILITSVYSKDAYKKGPTSLYGADDYVEPFSINEMLVPKLENLVPIQAQST